MHCTPRHSRAQPLLRWAGSKKRQFRVLRPYFPLRFDSYVEPFAGSASFLFRLKPTRAKINDINIDLYDFYQYAQSEPQDFYSDFLRIPRTAQSYYNTRLQFNSLPRSRLRTIYFYFLNRNCFNGIYRVNREGHFNVPFSDSKVSPYLSKEDFVQSSYVLQRTQLFCADFERFCYAAVSKDDFVFLDPPYYRPGTRIFNEYGLSSFLPTDFQRLDSLLSYLHRIGAKFLLSFPRTRDSIALSKKWTFAIRYVRRTIAGDFSARRKQSEMLIFNYEKDPA